MRNFIFTILVFLGFSVLLISCCMPVRYAPSFNSLPILSLNIQDNIETLSAIPRNETIVTNGVNKHTGRQSSGGAKESFFLKTDDAGYFFTLYNTTAQAIKAYNFEKNHGAPDIPIFSSSKNGNRRFYIRYIEQSRNDLEGGCLLTDNYYSGFGFQIQNIFVKVNIQQNEKESEVLNQAIQYLADYLNKVIANGNDGS